jgi:uncharacterized membrane protein
MTDSRLRIAAAVLALAGVGVAGYLTWVHYADLEPICAGGSGGCEEVQNSDYAKLAGVPVALLGLIGYVAILATLAIPGDAGRFAGALLALAGFGFSAWLTYVELFEIDAICQWCVASAVIMTALAVVTSLRFATPPPAGSAHPRS